jgi:cytochrome c-type biogenesis protein CcmH
MWLQGNDRESPRVIENLGFWAAAAGMTVAVGAVLILALRREGQAAPQHNDAQMYRDQLADVARDVARGIVPPEEEARLRTEIGRRLLEADREAVKVPSATAPSQRRLWSAIVAVLLLGAVGLYLRWGAPGYPDLPLALRHQMSDEVLAGRMSQAEAMAQASVAPALPPPDAAFADLMDKLRKTVAERPDDVTGLALLARNEAALGNLAAAEDAQRRMIGVKGVAATAADHASLADIMIRAAGGFVSPEAEAELIAALERDPKDGVARYFSGLMFAQAGRYDRTFLMWQTLLDEGPADAPWIAPIRAQIGEIAQRAGINFDLPPEPGPDAGDIAAAAEMTPEDRQAMIEGMVGQLSDRLASQGGPAEDWAKLIRALGVLQDTEQAMAIYAEAQTRFAGDGAALSFLKEAALEAGLVP